MWEEAEEEEMVVEEEDEAVAAATSGARWWGGVGSVVAAAVAAAAAVVVLAIGEVVVLAAVMAVVVGDMISCVWSIARREASVAMVVAAVGESTVDGGAAVRLVLPWCASIERVCARVFLRTWTRV